MAGEGGRRGLTLRSAASTVFSQSHQREKQIAPRALQLAGRAALALTPPAQPVLTSIQVLTCVCPRAGGNSRCSSHFARGSGVCSRGQQLRLPSLFLDLRSSLPSWHRVPASLSRERHIWYWHPGREPKGLPMPSAFPVDWKTRDYEVRPGIAHGVGSVPSHFGGSGDFSHQSC